MRGCVTIHAVGLRCGDRGRRASLRATQEMAMVKQVTRYPSPHACAVRERTADGVSVGRCWFNVVDDKCPRHGDVSKVQAEYVRTGRLTDEGDLYDARGERPPWWGIANRNRAQ